MSHQLGNLMLITPLIAAICALLYIYLSYAVIQQRFSKGVALGSGGEPELEIEIRAHANFAEYVPFALILLWFVETVTYEHNLALILGCVLIIARIAHVFGLRNHKELLILRQLGVVATFIVILICAGKIFWHYLPILGLSA